MRWLAKSAERVLHWWLLAHHTSQSEKPNTSALLIPSHRLVLDQGKVQSSYKERLWHLGCDPREPWRPWSAWGWWARPGRPMSGHAVGGAIEHAVAKH